MLFLALEGQLDLSPRVNAALRAIVAAVLILLVARPVLTFHVTRPWASVALGILVFIVWIAPDQLFPGYRSLSLFQNNIVGRVESSVPPAARGDLVVLALRAFRGIVVVPIVEELFFRGWLPRWIDRFDDFRSIQVGTFTTLSFWATAGLFAVEHGSYWEVGLAAGLLYNWWIRRSKSLADVTLAHAVTNACLAIWVMATGQWQYW
jgi:uncharacterized protein